MFNSESFFLPLQRLQLEHDRFSHQDILSSDHYKKLKHMVLHFYKYCWRIQDAMERGDSVLLEKTLVDSFVICLASANALNISLGKEILLGHPCGDSRVMLSELSKQFDFSGGVSAFVLRRMIAIGGSMAKVMESSDHMEIGNPRADMPVLVCELTKVVLASLGELGLDVEHSVRSRFRQVEQKSIFFVE